jgi:hypothetical protein
VRLGYGLVLLLALTAMGADRARPTSRPSAAAQKASNAAIKALSAEAASAAPRQKCDYFVEHPTAGLTPEMVLMVLSRPLGDDTTTECYVRWQLLSALPEQLDAKQAEALLRCYVDAPPPMPRPGMTQIDRQRWDRVLQRAGKDDEAALREQLADQTDAVARGNTPVLAYRDELFSRLPDSYGKYQAALADAWERVDCGVDARAFVRAVIGGMRAWAIGADEEQLATLSEDVRGLRSRRPGEYYADVVWSETRLRMTARRQRRSLEGKDLADLIEFLDQRANSGTQPLRMRQK